MKFGEKYLSGNYYVKFGHFSGKNDVKFGHFADFNRYFSGKNFVPPPL